MKTSEPIAGGAQVSCELASRGNDGVHVRLLWHPKDGAVTVAVDDSRAGRRFELAIEYHRALDAFYHSYAYAA
jgi:hypothetical protein